MREIKKRKVSKEQRIKDLKFISKLFIFLTIFLTVAFLILIAILDNMKESERDGWNFYYSTSDENHYLKAENELLRDKIIALNESKYIYKMSFDKCWSDWSDGVYFYDDLIQTYFDIREQKQNAMFELALCKEGVETWEEYVTLKYGDGYIEAVK